VTPAATLDGLPIPTNLWQVDDKCSADASCFSAADPSSSIHVQHRLDYLAAGPAKVSDPAEPVLTEKCEYCVSQLTYICEDTTFWSMHVFIT
jgi:hypothetical protein